MVQLGRGTIPCCDRGCQIGSSEQQALPPSLSTATLSTSPVPQTSATLIFFTDTASSPSITGSLLNSCKMFCTSSVLIWIRLLRIRGGWVTGSMGGQVGLCLLV